MSSDVNAVNETVAQQTAFVRVYPETRDQVQMMQASEVAAGKPRRTFADIIGAAVERYAKKRIAPRRKSERKPEAT